MVYMYIRRSLGNNETAAVYNEQLIIRTNHKIINHSTGVRVFFFLSILVLLSAEAISGARRVVGGNSKEEKQT